MAAETKLGRVKYGGNTGGKYGDGTFTISFRTRRVNAKPNGPPAGGPFGFS
jgi:hypothetical protein